MDINKFREIQSTPNGWEDKWETTNGKQNTNNVFSVVVWRDTRGFESHRITPFIAVAVFLIHAESQRAAFNRCVNEFKERFPNINRGKVLIWKGLHFSTHEKTQNIILADTFGN